MKTNTKQIIAALALALVLPLAACGSSANSSDAKESDEAYYATGGYGAPAAAEEGYYVASDEAYEAEMEYPEPSPSEGLVSGTTLNLTTTSTPAATDTQKLVYSAYVSIDTTDYQATVVALRDLMAQTGSFAEYEDEWTYDSYGTHMLEVTIRVPAANYNELMTGIDDVEGTVTNRTSSVTNITRTYNDNEAIIEGLEIQEQRLLEMMGQAESVEEMLLVEERLSEVQTQLNRARTSRESMDSDVSLSTVHVRINEVRRETTTGHESYLTRVGTAFADMWEDFVEGVGDFFIGLIYAIPAIVILAVVLFAGSRVVRGLRERRASKRAGAAPVAPSTPAAPVAPSVPEQTMPEQIDDAH